MALMKLVLVAALSVLLAPVAAAGTIVQVTIHGTVAFNQINKVPFNTVTAGQAATLSFKLDSDVFVNSPSFPTRGYVIDQSSFALTFPSASVPLQSPFPAGKTPYFVLRNNDPAVDGFLLSTDVNGPVAPPLAPTGSFGQFTSYFLVTYGGSKLSSLDILGAVGTYDFTGLSVFGWSVDDGPVSPLGIDFVSMTIEVVTPTWFDEGHALAGIAGSPKLVGAGNLSAGSPNALTLTRAAPNAMAGLVVGLSNASLPFKGGTLVPAPDVGPVLVPTSGGGGISLPFTMPAGLPAGTALWLQWAIPDAAAVKGVALSNALKGVTP
jgi:hypothetical protein